jgi:hypothetical protein
MADGQGITFDTRFVAWVTYGLFSEESCDMRQFSFCYQM